MVVYAKAVTSLTKESDDTEITNTLGSYQLDPYLLGKDAKIKTINKMKIKTHTPTGLRYACIEGYQYGTLVSNDHPD